MLWLVQEGDNYVDGGYHYMSPISFVKCYRSIYVDHTLMIDAKLRKFNFPFLKWSFTCESVNNIVFKDQFAYK